MIKLLKGNAYELIKTIPDKSVDLIYTDIPYDFEGNGGGGAFGSKKRDYHNEYLKVSELNKENGTSGLDFGTTKCIGSLENIAFGIDYKILNEFVRVQPTINIYIWCSKKQMLPIMKFFVDKNGCYFDLFVWHKNNPIPACNNKYLNDLEYCLFFRQEGTKIGGTYETKSKCYQSGLNVKDKELYNHPTIKPLEFVKNHIINSTKDGQVVFDPFMGSGTTGVACKELNRSFIGFELDNNYFEIAQDRINGITQVEKKQLNEGQMQLDLWGKE